MNGKNMLVGLSYIDRKFIEESEKEMPVQERAESAKPNSGRIPTRKLFLIAALIAAMLLLMGAATYTRWSRSMQNTYHPSESQRQQAEQSGLSVRYQETESGEAGTEAASQEGSILSATDQGITVSLVQTIADSREVHIILRVEGFEPPEGYEITPYAFEGEQATLGGRDDFWYSSGMDFDDDIVYQGGGKYTYTDGTPVDEQDGLQMGHYRRSDGSMEVDVWYRLNSDAEELLGQEYQLHLTGFGTSTYVGKADATFETLVEGHWDLKFPLKAENTNIQFQPNVRLSDNVTLTDVEIGQITVKAKYITDTYWSGWEQLEFLSPALAGVVLKDGTLIPVLSTTEGYPNPDELIYTADYGTMGAMIDLSQVKALAYRVGEETAADGSRTPVYQYVPVP